MTQYSKSQASAEKGEAAVEVLLRTRAIMVASKAGARAVDSPVGDVTSMVAGGQLPFPVITNL